MNAITEPGNGLISLRILLLKPKNEVELQMLIQVYLNHILLLEKKLKATVLVFSGPVLEVERVWILLLDGSIIK